MRIDVRCELPQLKAELVRALETQGWRVRDDASWHLLVDAPWGWASKCHPGLCYPRTLILADNPCAEYQLDLLEHHPAALLLAATLEDIVGALKACRRGDPVYPEVSSPLTPVERATLQLIARGYTNKEIAAARGVSDGTVKNVTQVVYAKLGLRSRVQLAHYYYGNWHLLEGWEPPRQA